MINRLKNRKGFTLAEVLIVVAILIILFGIGVPSIFLIQRNLRQAELDAKAETIYVAVQNKLSKMQAAGNTDVLQADTEGSFVYGYGTGKSYPSVYDEKTGSVLCYFTSADYSAQKSAAAAVMGDDTVDAELRDNHWVVEFNPVNCTVCAVFYSENKADCATEYAVTDYGTYATTYREKASRLSAGAKVGYYGGDAAGSGDKLTEISPAIQVFNAETLTAKVTCTVPSTVSYSPVFKVEISDGNNTCTEYYAWSGVDSEYKSSIESTAGGSDKVKYLIERTGTSRTYTLDLTLDDLSRADTRFHTRYPDLDCGTPITVKVTAMCPGHKTVSGNHSATVTTNSLFADSSTVSTDGANTTITAEIGYARHLQNLDSSSGVNDSADVIVAEQIADISFANTDATGVKDWVETYAANTASYYNGRDAENSPLFEPIANTALLSYDGNGHTIAGLNVDTANDASADTANAGLFDSLSANQIVHNVTLTGAKVSSASNAGALVGAITGTGAALKDCQVYLTESDIGTGDNKKDNTYVWISGNTAGGLVGAVSGGTVTITSCSASSVVSGTAYAGGLIGSAASGTVTLTGSYADNYLTGATTGGLVGAGSANLTINTCYAAGFMSYTTTGAGLVDTAKEIKNAYSIVVNLDGTKPAVQTSDCSDVENVYYMPTSDNTLTGFVSAPDGDDTKPVFYNLKQGLNIESYTYPVLNGLRHYGDYGTVSGYTLTLENDADSTTTQVWHALFTEALSDIAAVGDSTTGTTYANSKPTRQNYTLQGWYAKDSNGNLSATAVLNADGKVVADTGTYTGFTVAADGDNETMTLSADVTLYAVWKEDGHTLTLQNGTQTGSPTKDYTISGAVDSVSLGDWTPTGADKWVLDGWYIAASMDGEKPSSVKVLDNSGKVVAADGNYEGFSVSGGKLTLTTNVTLYACWHLKTTGEVYKLVDTFSYQNANSSLLYNITSVSTQTQNKVRGQYTLGQCNDYIIASADSGEAYAVYAGESGLSYAKVTISKDASGSYIDTAVSGNENVGNYLWSAVPSRYYLGKDSNGNEFISDQYLGGGVSSLGENILDDDYGRFFHLVNNGKYLTRQVTKQMTSEGEKWNAEQDPIVSTSLYDSFNWSFEFRMFRYSDGRLITRYDKAGQYALYFDLSNPENPVLYSQLQSGHSPSNVYIYTKQTVDTDAYTFDFYTVNYNVQGGTPIDPSSVVVKAGAQITLPEAEREGYTFKGWTKDSAAAEAAYNSGDSYTVNADVTFYAVWEPISYTVKFDANVPDGVAVSGETADQTMTYGEEYTLNENGYAAAGYSFAGWNTEPDGSGTAYADKAEHVSNLTTGDEVTLYAQWTPITYTIVFDANGGSGDQMPDQTMVYDETSNLTKNTYAPETGYFFAGWNTAADGTGDSYTDEQSVKNLSATADETVTLYAQWTPVTYTLHLVGTGTSGTGENTWTITKDLSSLSSLSGYDVPKKDGWAFDGWCLGRGQAQVIGADGAISNITQYADSNTKTVTLYARWTRTAYRQTSTVDTSKSYLMGGAVSGNNARLIYGQGANSKTDSANVSCTSGSYATSAAGGTGTAVLLIDPSSINDSYRWKMEGSGSSYNLYYNSDSAKYYLYYTGSLFGTYLYTSSSKKLDWKISQSSITTTGVSWSFGVTLYINPSSLKLHTASYDCYLYEEISVYAWSGYSGTGTGTSGSGTTIAVNSVARANTTTDTVDPILDGASAAIETTDTYTLTLQNGSTVWNTTAVPTGTTSIPGYTAPTRTDTSWTLDGWYTATDGTGEKVLNADGTAVGGALDLTGDTTLYARWSRLTDAYVQTDTLEPGESYLIAAVPDADAPNTLLALGRTAQDADDYLQYVYAVDPAQTAGEYSLYDTATGETSAMPAAYITNVTQDLVWYCTDEYDQQNDVYYTGALYSRGGYIVLDDSESGRSFTWDIGRSTLGWTYNTDTGTLQAVNAYGDTVNLSFWQNDEACGFAFEENCYQYILLYKRTTVQQVSFGDETMALTLNFDTTGTTYSVRVADGYWTDALADLGYNTPESDGFEFLGWYDSMADDAAQVLDKNGQFAAQYIDGFVQDWQWIGGSNVTLYARWQLIPEEETAEDQPTSDEFVTTETAEDPAPAEAAEEPAEQTEQPAEEPAQQPEAEQPAETEQVPEETYTEETPAPAEPEADDSAEEIIP